MTTTAFPEMDNFALAWSAHVEYAIDEQLVYYGFPSTVCSRLIVEVLAYLHETPEELCYVYVMGRKLQTDKPNLIRRLSRWEKIGLVTSSLTESYGHAFKPVRLYRLTKAGRALGWQAAQVWASPQWATWQPDGRV